MKKYNNRLIILILILILLIVSFVYLSFGIKTRISGIEDLKVQLERRALLPDTDELQSKIISLNQKIPQLNSYLIDPDNPVSFIESIERLASSHGLSYELSNADTKDKFVEIVSDGKKEQKRVGGRLDLNISVTGSVSSIRNFISSIENLDKEVFIESVRISKVESETGVDWNGLFAISGITN